MDKLTNDFTKADCVADYFLAAMIGQSGDYMSNLKLQKLCYFAQGWHLAYLDKPLFDDEIQAWAHGPVVVSLFHRFKKYKWRPIDLDDRKANPYDHLEKDSLNLLKAIWGHFGHWSAKQLEMLSHEQKPWIDAYGDRSWGTACNEVITHDVMKAYFISAIPND
ncbi:MAG: Panacea domain-containing protein [Alphaproteobacteria bacterium]